MSIDCDPETRRKKLTLLEELDAAIFCLLDCDNLPRLRESSVITW